ncbi:hemerythrin domain-containing protein [Streptomyces sp. NPDC090445]|uniref:hemerythrin domain-containing protein n=1 Tax=Streptomyces sp. NPDC090445 TaxID=3365963 RepID=UPI00382573FA
MTTPSDTSDSTAHPYTREMAMIHQVFRRESRLLAELVQDVCPADIARARVLAEHWRQYSVGLHAHHTGEDEMLWPVLLPHLDLDAEQVLAMEAQHRELDEGIAEVQRLMDRWQAQALPADRDELAEALRTHHRQLCAHLDEEEREVMPLVALHVNEKQWLAVGERGLAETPKNRLMIALGAILEDTSPEKRQEFLARLPVPARVLWKLLGQRQYRRETARIRGRRTTA